MYLLTPVRGSHAGVMIIQRPTYHIASFAVAALLAKCLPRIQASSRVTVPARRCPASNARKKEDISIVLLKEFTIEVLDDFFEISLGHGHDLCKGAQKEAVVLQVC